MSPLAILSPTNLVLRGKNWRWRIYEVDIAGVWSAPAEKVEVIRWVQAARDTLQPFAHGVYVNQLGDTSDQLVRSAYGPNYAHLVEMKKKYDPNNVLHLNQNINPHNAPKS